MSQHSEKKRKSNAPSVICTVLGIVFLVVVVAACMPMVLPKVLGMSAYDITSGSMEPTIPVGSLIVVEPGDAAEIQVDDVIAYSSDESVVAHRVVENHVVDGQIITKGDANEVVDALPVEYSSVIGKVVLHVPIIGDYMNVLSGLVGKLYLIGVAIIGVLFLILGSRLKVKKA